MMKSVGKTKKKKRIQIKSQTQYNIINSPLKEGEKLNNYL